MRQGMHEKSQYCHMITPNRLERCKKNGEVFGFVDDGQGLCPWNPLREMISPSPPQQDLCNYKG